MKLMKQSHFFITLICFRQRRKERPADAGAGTERPGCEEPRENQLGELIGQSRCHIKSWLLSLIG